MSRGSKPGEHRGGRAPGTPNKRTAELAERLVELGCDPLEGLVKIALDPGTDAHLRARVLGDLMGYVYPKRKAIEVETHQAGALDDVPTAVLQAIAAQLEASLRADAAGEAVPSAKHPTH